MRIVTLYLLFIAFVLAGCRHVESAAQRSMTLATTTSTRDSGLLDTLMPQFKSKTGIDVKVVAVGSGQALELGRRGDADVLLTHAPAAEEEFMHQGFGAQRQSVMHNDFVLVGPVADPVGVKGTTSIEQAYRRLAASSAQYVSRGDRSGTYMKEQHLLKLAQVSAAGEWFIEAGSGMAATLRMASEKNAYTLTDRGTFLAQSERLQLAILVEGDVLLQNPYTVILVSPKKFPHIHQLEAKAFRDFLLDPETQQVIATFGVKKFGQPLFFPPDTH